MRHFIKFIILSLVLNGCSKSTISQDENELDKLFRFSIQINGKNIDKTKNKYEIKFESLDGINPIIQGEELNFAGHTDGSNYLYFRLYPYGRYPEYPNLLKKSLVREIKFTLFENNKELMSKVVTTSAKKIVNKNGEWYEITKLDIGELNYLDKVKNKTIVLNLKK